MMPMAWALMLVWPTSSPNITRMLGFLPPAGACACSIVRAPTTPNAASAVPPRRMRRRSALILSVIIASPSDDAAKSDMAGRRIDRLGMACGGAIAPAVVGRAEVRAALQDLAGNFDRGLAGVVAALHRRAARILG